MENLTTTQLAIALIRPMESCRLRAYWDALGKVWTIGWGHTKGVVEGQTRTQTEADQWLGDDLAPLLDLVCHLPTIQGAALVSFGHNCGIGAMQQVLSGSIAPTIKGFITKSGSFYGSTAKGVYSQGLNNRRMLESALYLAGKV